MEKCIASIATPLGAGAISIVRLSGKDSLQIAQKVFHAKNLEEIQPRHMYFGKLELEKNTFEECLMVFFKAPFSYTGEDVVEFQVHGGVLLAQKILEKVLDAGAILAEPGEFSKRAFLNGKITLDKAEAIIGEINAESEGELVSSLKVTNGKLAQEILTAQETLKTILAELEVGMDYSDETEETKLKGDIFSRLQKIEENVEEILENSKSAKYLKDGINVALVGRTNVGKSSIMNALLGQERAIVTDIQGTTRDQIVESFVFDGVKFNLIDTAGIRETKDLVENLGIEKSKQSARQADVVLFVLDGSEKLSQDDKKIKKLLQKSAKNVIFVINKTDKTRVLEKQKNEIEISALENKNISNLKKKIKDLVIEKEIDFNKLVITNQRQFSILQDAKNLVEEILKNTTNLLSLDILSMQIKKVWQILGKITGNTENEDIIDLIFSKFCLGK